MTEQVIRFYETGGPEVLRLSQALAAPGPGGPGRAPSLGLTLSIPITVRTLPVPCPAAWALKPAVWWKPWGRASYCRGGSSGLGSGALGAYASSSLDLAQPTHSPGRFRRSGGGDHAGHDCGLSPYPNPGADQR